MIVLPILRFVRRPIHPRRMASSFACGWLSVLALLHASAVPLEPSQRVRFGTLDAAPLAGEPGPVATASFRLGTAAKPFGWSTVIGDFNADGRPDVAVADRIGQRNGQYTYKIGFSVSG